MSNKDKYKLWKRKNGFIYICVGSGTNTRRVSTGTKVHAEAEQYRAQFIEGLKNPPPKPNPTIREILLEYQKARKDIRSADRIKDSNKPLIAFFGNLKPEHITITILKDYAQHRKQDGKRRGNQMIKEPISDGTILREVGVLKAALHYAAGERWIPPVPTLEAPVPKPEPNDIWLSRSEVKKLMDKASSPHIRLFIQIAIYTAARSGAILELKWDNIDFDRRLIDFGRGHGKKRRSVVPMNQDLYEALVQAYTTSCSSWVIELSNKPIKSIKGAFRRLTINCGIDATAHVLRHTAATWMVMDGVPLAEIARLLGDTEKTVEKVYGKHTPGYLKRAVSSLTVRGEVQLHYDLERIVH
jgi:integrase